MTTAGTPAGPAADAADAADAAAIPATRAEVCAVACAEAWRGDGEILASAFGAVPTIGARLARATFSPDLLISDGEATLGAGTWAVDEEPAEVEGWLPFRHVFDMVWSGRRHAMMIPSQLDRYGNSNISAIGPFHRPTAQLLGMRGAPGNTVSHPCSYWVPRHSPRVFVPTVDVVCGVGFDRAAAAGPTGSRYHEIRRVVTNLAVLDFATPDRRMRLVSVHPGVTVPEVVEATGTALAVAAEVPVTRWPTPAELRLVREVIDPRGRRCAEVPD